MADLLLAPFREPFMARALVVLLVLGVLSGVMGVYVVLRRLAFAGEAMTHTVFPGVAVAAVLGHDLAWGALVAGALSAALLAVLARRPRVDEDVALAVLLTGFFAVGVVVVSRRDSYTSDLTNLLFGRVLTVDRGDVVRTVVVATVVLAVLAALHKELLLRAFDPEGAAALGYAVLRLDLVLHLLLALVVVAAVQAVGTVLVVALLVVPAATARLLSDRLPVVFALSVAAGLLAGWLGLVVSYAASVDHGLRLASGATVVMVLVVLYAAAACAAALLRHRRLPGTLT